MPTEADVPEARRFELDGRVLNVARELGMWSVWIEGETGSQVTGHPLENVIAEVVGLNPAHDEIPPGIALLAQRIKGELHSEN